MLGDFVDLGLELLEVQVFLVRGSGRELGDFSFGGLELGYEPVVLLLKYGILVVDHCILLLNYVQL